MITEDVSLNVPSTFIKISLWVKNSHQHRLVSAEISGQNEQRR